MMAGNIAVIDEGEEDSSTDGISPTNPRSTLPLSPTLAGSQPVPNGDAGNGGEGIFATTLAAISSTCLPPIELDGSIDDGKDVQGKEAKIPLR